MKTPVALAFVSTVCLCQAYIPVDPKAYQNAVDAVAAAWNKPAADGAFQEAVKAHHKTIIGKCLSLPKQKQLTLTMIEFMCSDPDKNLENCVAPQGKPELAKVWSYFNNDRLRSRSNKKRNPFCLVDVEEERTNRPYDCFFKEMPAAECLEHGKTGYTAVGLIYAIGSVGGSQNYS